jgi:uncharacterized membrane protein YcaP (DUF421 family)
MGDCLKEPAKEIFMSHDLQSLLHFEVAPWSLVVRALVVYLGVLLLLRISGKRQIAQMGATEFVAILLISNAVQNSMNGGDNSLIGGMLLAVTLIVLSSGISYFTYKSKIISTIFEGTPTLIIRNGKLIKKNIERERLSETEVKTMLRKQGIQTCHDIAVGILEADGTLSVTRINEHPTHLEESPQSV